uniref:Bardet-Biedl syndrome 2 protein homolog n=1 Tax=Globodera pallida TaxID=36090 RepID=A0A183BPI1_GLOPA
MSAVGGRGQQLRAAFSFGFAHRLAQGGGAAGVFDGSGREQLAVGTETGKICLQAIESMFNVNEQITCLAIYPRTRTDADHYDVVLVGTTSSLLALDVYNNRTLFHRNMPEGVHCVRVGHVDAHRDSDVIVCGCGTTIWGFHLDGSDVFWTALGDEVNVIELCDMDGDGQNELIVGTGGADIKVLKNASFFAEFDEGNPTTALCALGPACFAFGLASGVVGVYANGERLWRVKTKSPIVALLQFPAHARVATGEICAREQFEDGGELSAAFLADLAGTGPLDDGQPRPQLTLVFCNGQVRALEFCNELADEKGQLLRNISQRKHALLEELKTYDRRGSNASAAEAGGGGVAECSLIPPGTMLTCTLALMSAAEQQEHAASAVAASSSSPTNDVTAVTVWSSSSSNAHAARNASGDSLCVRLTLSNSVPIRAVLLFADGIFDSECIAIHPNGKESAEMVVQFNPVKNVQANLFVKVFAGYSIERQLRVFAADLLLPRFVTFVQVEPPTFAETPEAFVAFRLHCRENKLREWVFENFAFIGEQQVDADEAETDQQHNKNNNNNSSSKFQLRFMCTRNQQPLLLELDTAGGNVELRHNDIQNAADILQSLCAFLGVRALSSRAHFPQVLDAVKSVVENMDRRYEVNERLASEFAERLNVVRECVVRAEDALAIQNFAESRRLYTRVTMLNRELCGQQTIWMAAKKELLDAMKFLNVSIEQFSRLRVGAPGASLVQECRKAIAGDKLDIVPKLLEFGVFD